MEEEAWKVTLEKENSPTTLVTSSDNEDEDEDKDVSRVYQVVNKRTCVYIYIYIFFFFRQFA